MKSNNYWIIPIVIVPVLFVTIINKNETPEEPADLILTGGKIITVDEDRPEAEALAVKGDRITAVGTENNIRKYIGPRTRVIRLDDKIAVPGFIDSHAHFLSLGQSRQQLDLTRARSWEEIISLVQSAAAKARPGEWISGRGWHQEKWDSIPEPNFNGLPYHTALSRISPDNPVILTHASGHSSIVNTKAMRLAEIDKETPDPRGGEIVRDEKGNPIGVLRETAQDLMHTAIARDISRRTPEEIERDRIRTFELAVRECLAKGITSFHDAGVPFDMIDFYKEMAGRGLLKIRINAMIQESSHRLDDRIDEYRIIGYADHHLTVRSIKRLIDGALGAHGAWLLEPYDSLPGSCGLNTESAEEMRRTARIAMDHGFQLCTHAIGDRGNRETLDIYKEYLPSDTGKTNLRWRIEHAQHLHPDDIPRFAGMGIIAAMQGIHCTSDAPWVIKRLGEKRAEEGAYVWRKLIDSGAVISNGTDAPVEAVDPIPCFYASVSRRLEDGTVFFGNQRMSREEALRSYTLNGAYASFEEDIKGSLAPGKLADIVVLSRDIMTIPEEEILQAEVLMTIVGGKVLYTKDRLNGESE